MWRRAAQKERLRLLACGDLTRKRDVYQPAGAPERRGASHASGGHFVPRSPPQCLVAHTLGMPVVQSGPATVLLEPPAPSPWTERNAAREGPVSASDFELAEVSRLERHPKQFRAALRAETDRGRAALPVVMAFSVAEQSAADRVLLDGSAYTLSIVIERDVETTRVRWRLAPGGSDATARADILSFLRALTGRGLLTIEDLDAARFVGRLRLDGGGWDADLERQYVFIEDLATLEEWTGVPLPVPPWADRSEVAMVTQAARFARDGEVLATLARPISVIAPVQDVSDTTTITIEQDFGFQVFGYDVPLGTGTADVRVRLDEVQPEENDPELRRYVYVAADPDRSIVFRLRAPIQPDGFARRSALAGDAPADIEASDEDQRWALEAARRISPFHSPEEAPGTPAAQTDEEFLAELDRRTG
jgi:hypothetical protein